MAALLADMRRTGSPALVQAGLSAALVAGHEEVAAWLNPFWQGMEQRARRAIGWGERLTLDTFTDAVLAETISGDDHHAAIPGQGYFTAGEAALLVPRSSSAPGLGATPIKGDQFGMLTVKAKPDRLAELIAAPAKPGERATNASAIEKPWER